MNGLIRVLLLLLSVWITPGVTRYCTRTFHSAIVNNQTLFIDGGEVRNLNESSGLIVPEAVHDLLSIDLSKSWRNSDSNLFTTIKKPYNASNPDIYPPIMNEGASYSDGSNLYFWGGYISAHNGPPKPPPLDTWRYNIASDHWTRDGFGGESLNARLIEGGVAQSTVHKRAYYLGGIVDPGGNAGIFGTDGAGPYNTDGLLRLDQNTLEWRNFSTKDMNHYGTINDGYMNLIDYIGDEGILVAFGGNTHPIGEKQSLLAGEQNDPDNKNSMEFISIYDIANEEWYTQQSTGDIPQWRMSGCSVVVPAQDLSSFSIYVYGGMGNGTAVSDGDVYVLSLPSFQWVRVHEGADIRIKHKCQLAGKHTMLVIGGTVPRDRREYEPIEVNCDTDTFANGVGIFDLRSHTWLSNYDAEDDGDYTINSDISDVIGGGETGGATVTEPKNGFNNTQLQSLFNNTHPITPSSSSSSTSTPTGQSSGNTISKGGIAGATVGAVAGAAAIGGLVFFLVVYRRRKAQQNAEISDSQKHAQANWAELHGESTALELGTKANVQEMPADWQHPLELEGDTVPEIGTSQVRT